MPSAKGLLVLASALLLSARLSDKLAWSTVLLPSASLLLYRSLRNAALPGTPETVPTRYAPVPPEDLAKHVTVVVSAKDFLSQATEQLEYMRQVVPKDIAMLYTFPRAVGIDEQAYREDVRRTISAFPNARLVELEAFANPFDGWKRAADLVRTKYTLFLHNDVYPMDPETFLSELYAALEAHPEYAAAAPQIYEAERPGELVAHTINTNLHLRRKPDGVLFVSHEVDATAGTKRARGDFREGAQADFLEDHAFLLRSSYIRSVVDPPAAYTMEYMDSQISLRCMNTTVWFTPSARVEFRIWARNVRWRDLPFFAYRRSERLARSTKAYLEDKWGVEFPNTGFGAYVKYSTLRHVELSAARGELPEAWEYQASLVAAWFEWIGFNYYRAPASAASENVRLPELLERARALVGTGVRATRELFHVAPVTGTVGKRNIEAVLPLREREELPETRLPFEHLSLGVVRAAFPGVCDAEAAPSFAAVQHLCGLVTERPSGAKGGGPECTCWIYVAPYEFYNPFTSLIERLASTFKMAPRVAVYFSWLATMRDLHESRNEIETVVRLAAGSADVSVTVCGEHEDDCETAFAFPGDARLLRWAGRLNSWSRVRPALEAISNGISAGTALKWNRFLVGSLAALMILFGSTLSRNCLLGISAVVCLQAVVPAASQALLLRVLAVPGALVALVHVPLAHHRKAALALSLTALGGAVALALGLGSTTRLGQGYVSCQLIACVLVGLVLRRARVLLLTARATAPTAIVFRLASHFFPAYSYDERAFFAADRAPEKVQATRRDAFDKLSASWRQKWPHAAELGHFLRAHFSDLRFASSNRVYLPFNKLLGESFDPATVAEATEGPCIVDVDGQSLLDAAGSYGVNVCGYEAYKGFLQEGFDKAKNLGCVLGPLSRTTLDNIKALQRVSGKEEVSFHMSGTEAVMSAVRVARFNTQKKLVVLFGGAYHGWWDGVQTTAGNERSVDDTLTLRDLDDLSLEVIRTRGKEIAAVLVNPLQSFHPNSAPPSDVALVSNSRKAGEASEYAAWLGKLKRACAEAGVVLVFDEVYTGFRLAPGGAQEYFGVQADIVCYGKTLGGGLPVGAVCGPSHLMARTDPSKPLRVAYVVGTFAAHPVVMETMAAFLRWLEAPGTPAKYDGARARVARWVADTNAALAAEDLPLRVASYATVWTMLFQRPGRYHWMLQYYLRDEGVQLSWVGTGRLNFSLDWEEAHFEALRAKLLAACRRMRDDGWWWADERGNAAIKWQLAQELLQAATARVTLWWWRAVFGRLYRWSAVITRTI